MRRYDDRLHPGLYGNYEPEDIPLLEQAATETGFEIEVRDDARDVHGQPVPGCVAVYVKGEFRDRTPMGRRFRELIKAARAAVASARGDEYFPSASDFDGLMEPDIDTPFDGFP